MIWRNVTLTAWARWICSASWVSVNESSPSSSHGVPGSTPATSATETSSTRSQTRAIIRGRRSAAEAGGADGTAVDMGTGFSRVGTYAAATGRTGSAALDPGASNETDGTDDTDDNDGTDD